MQCTTVKLSDFYLLVLHTKQVILAIIAHCISEGS